MIGRRSFIAGLIAAPVMVRATSLDFVPRDLTKLHAKQWWWNPQPMCGMDVGFFFGAKPIGSGWRGIDEAGGGYRCFHAFPHGGVRSTDPATFNRYNWEAD